MTRLPDGLKISVEGNITTHNVIHKTALAKTYRSYLKHESSKYLWSNRIVSDEEYHNAWCDSRYDRCKKTLSRLIRRIVCNFKYFKSFNR